VHAVTCLAGRYRLAGRLGEGGMAVVWRAHDDVLERVVAIKVLGPGQALDAAARARVQSEARAAAALSHPNVAAVHDYGEAPGPSGEPVPYVVMELVDGVSLTDLLADGPVDPADAMRICADVAAGLAAAHARGLVHRDVKPGNVIVAPGGAKLVDFGIAAAIGSPDEADDDGVMLGTPAYLAPERLADGVVVPGSDVYALGLLLYRMLAGTTPWPVHTTTQMLKAHAYLPPHPLPAVDGVPAEVADLCRRCLAKDPVDRPSAMTVAAVLSGAARTGPAARPSAPDTPARSAATPGPGHRAGTADGPVSAGGAAKGVRGDEPKAGTAGTTGAAGTTDRRRRRRLVVLAAVVAVLVAGLFLALPRLVGSPSGSRASANPQPGPGGIAVPGVPSFPAPVGGSGAVPRGPGSGGSVAGPGGAPDVSGTGAGVGTPGGPPAATATEPDGGTTPPAVPASTPPPNPARRTVDTTGGSAEVECAGTLARLISWTPAAGYETQAVQPGSNPTVQVKFRSGNNLVSIMAKCVNGVPDITVR
jgi:serine/threonine-protein kinase